MRLLFIALLSFQWLIVACGEAEESTPEEKEPVVLETKQGLASYYGRAFDGNKTASGTIFDHRDMVAAHPNYPMGTFVRVTNLESQDTVHVTITDRGPTKPNQQDGVIIDLSRGAADKIKMVAEGRVRVRVDVLEWGEQNTD